MSNAYPYGNRPVVYNDPDFSMAEAARLSGVEEKTIRNWIARDVTDAGAKFGGRWAFSFNDILKLKVAGYLVSTLCLEASAAARIAKEAGRMVAKRALEMSERNLATGKLIEHEAGVEHWQAILVSFKEGSATFWTAGSDPSRRDPPRHTNIDHDSLRRPYIVIPCDSIILEVMFDIEKLWAERDQVATSPFSESERLYLHSVRALSRDELDRDVLIGLSFVETEEYQQLIHDRQSECGETWDRKRYLELHGRHEAARLQRILAENRSKQ